MSMRTGVLIVLALLLGGCGQPRRGVAVRTPLPAASPADRPGANLALGSSADQLWAATQWNVRAPGPSISAGYRLGDVSYFTDIQFDDQYYFGRYGGFSRMAQTARSAVLLR